MVVTYALKLTTSVEDIRVTLKAHLIKKSEFNFFEGIDALLDHSLHIDVADADIAASYPNGTAVFNISRETTTKELSSIEGLDFEEVVRHETINLSGGVTNAVAFVNRMFSAPSLFDIDEEFRKQHQLT